MCFLKKCMVCGACQYLHIHLSREENTLLCLVYKQPLSLHSETPFSTNIYCLYHSLSLTSTILVTTVFDPMNAHVVDGSSVYLQYGLIFSLILNLRNKDIAFRVGAHFIHEICYLIQNIAEGNVISERQHVRRSLCVLMLHRLLGGCLRPPRHFFSVFQVAQQCHLMLPRQEKGTGRPSGTEGALLVGWWESWDWLYDAVCGSWNFPPSTCGHIYGRISFFLSKPNVHQCLY